MSDRLWGHHHHHHQLRTPWQVTCD